VLAGTKAGTATDADAAGADTSADEASETAATACVTSSTAPAVPDNAGWEGAVGAVDIGGGCVAAGVAATAPTEAGVTSIPWSFEEEDSMAAPASAGGAAAGETSATGALVPPTAPIFVASIAWAGPLSFSMMPAAPELFGGSGGAQHQHNTHTQRPHTCSAVLAKRVGLEGRVCGLTE